MNCPYCNAPFMAGMTVCPKCKYDIKARHGGAKHLQWLIDQGRDFSADLAAAYPEVIFHNPEVISHNEEAAKAAERMIEIKAEKDAAIANILISSGFDFDGYRILKYSGYISGDDAVQIPRSGIFGSDNGKKLTDALVKIRSRALAELKEAAYALGCNAVIGVDFDYITLEPETANLHGGTLYEPYIICVTANGNAVIIEKEDA